MRETSLPEPQPDDLFAADQYAGEQWTKITSAWSSYVATVPINRSDFYHAFLAGIAYERSKSGDTLT